MPASCHYFVQVSFALDSHRSFALPEQPSLMPVFYVLTSWGDLQIWVLVSIPGGPIIHPVSTNIPSFVKELLCFETKRCLIQAFTLRLGYVCRELFEKGENFNMVACLALHSFNVPLFSPSQAPPRAANLPSRPLFTQVLCCALRSAQDGAGPETFPVEESDGCKALRDFSRTNIKVFPLRS